ncbi:MAG: magnesium chelatase domain-containing protein, partial [Bacillota bacterium]
DLAVALAIYSTCKGLKGSSKVLAIGEIGLTGDLRSIQNAEKIVKEAARMGFVKIIMPQKNAARLTDVPSGIKVVGVNSLRDAIQTVQQP